MTRQYRTYTDKDIIEHAAKVYSLAQLLKALNLKYAGGNYNNMKRNLQRLNVNTDHWRGKGWSKDQQLKDWSEYTRSINFKRHLIDLRGRKCDCCELTEWLNKPITVELHHIDGNRVNNKLENLQLLCPNCHSYTDNWKTIKL